LDLHAGWGGAAIWGGADQNGVGTGERLQSGGEVGRVADDRLLARGAFADRLADHDEPARDADAYVDLWEADPNKNAVWHSSCVVAWQFWNTPSSQIGLLRLLQQRPCGQTGGRLWKNAEVDHRVPLFRVWSEHQDKPWPELLDFWGLPNLQVINRDAHVAKCAVEAGGRRAVPSPPSETTGQAAVSGTS
jgi:hypothetical protein